MRTTTLALAIAIGLTPAALGASPPKFDDPGFEMAPEETPTIDVTRFGLTGPVSTATLDTLASGIRVPVIVMLEEPKASDWVVPGTPAALQDRIYQISNARDAALSRAFGATGFERRASFQARRLDDEDDRAVVMREFVGTPGFSALVNADEIQRLRGTQGVAAVYEDSINELTLADTTLLTGAQTAWASGAEGSGVSVAILDTGVELEHPMTAAAVTASACFNQIVPGTSTSLCPGGAAQVTDLTSGSVGDSCVENEIDPTNGIDGCFHGTHVGSTAAGRTTSLSSGPISGMARQSDIIAVNVFAAFGSANCGGAPSCVLSWTSDQVAALDWLFVNNATLNLAAINMSLGGGQNSSACDSSDPRTNVINSLRAAGVATVIASGNDGFTNAVSTPGCVSSAITVGSTTKTDTVSSFSNSSALVDLLAPGSSIFAAWQSEQPAPGGSCIAAGSPTAPGPDGFCHWFANSSGTSMATPHVAGAFAMLSAAFPTATVTDIENALESTGVPITDSRNGRTIPRIQVDAAYTFLQNGGGGGGGGPTGPANNDFADRVTLSGSSASATGNNTGADKEAGEPNHAQAGGASVWWSWTATSNSRVTISTGGSNFDTLLGVYTGSDVASLTTIATNDDRGRRNLTSRVRFRPTAGVTYQIAVDGFNGAAGDITLSISQ